MILVLALGTLLLLAPLTVAYLTLGTSEMRIARNHLSHTQARACAESATEVQLHRVANGLGAQTNFDIPIFAGCVADVLAAPLVEGPNTIGIMATGKMAGAKSVVRVTLWQDETTGRWNTRNYRD